MSSNEKKNQVTAVIKTTIEETLKESFEQFKKEIADSDLQREATQHQINTLLTEIIDKLTLLQAGQTSVAKMSAKSARTTGSAPSASRSSSGAKPRLNGRTYIQKRCEEDKDYIKNHIDSDWLESIKDDSSLTKHDVDSVKYRRAIGVLWWNRSEENKKMIRAQLKEYNAMQSEKSIPEQLVA